MSVGRSPETVDTGSRRPSYVVGVDAGGTGSRALLATAAGQRRAAIRGAGVNPRSSTADPVDALADLLQRLVDAAPEAAGAVSCGVLALAGSGAAGLAAAEEAAVRAWRAATLPGRPTVVPDIVAAHAAGSPRICGTVLVSGTGAVAAAVTDGAVRRRADGHGWLLGDTGSGVWIGVQGVRAALAVLDGRMAGSTAPEALTPQILQMLSALDAGATVPTGHGERAALAQRVIAAVDRMRPAELAALCPVVSRAADAGDPVAQRIAAQAADGLLQSLRAVRGTGDMAGDDDGHVVLAGSVLLSPGPVRNQVRTTLRAECGVDARDAGDGAGGAAVVALRRCGLPVTDEVHARLTTAAPG